MNTFFALLSLPVKIYRNGFVWLYKRIKREFLYPSFTLTKYLCQLTEHLRRKTSKKKVVPNIISSNTLLVVYDFNIEAITFDFAMFLAAAETFAKNAGKSELFLLFVKKDPSGPSYGDYSTAVSEDSQQWRINNVVLQLAHLYPACTGYSIVSHDSEILKLIPEKSIYPNGYSLTYKPSISYADIFKLLNLKMFSGFQTPKNGIKYIDAWKKANGISKPIVVITIRQYGYDVTRNSNLEEWAKFAHWVKDEGFTPVIVPDVDACWVSTSLFDDFIVFTDPCWNLGLRIALNELAFVNLFYSSGLAAICLLSKHLRYIAFNPIVEGSKEASPEKIKPYNLNHGQRRYNFAEPHQFLSWKIDSFENIRDEFNEFRKYFPPV